MQLLRLSLFVLLMGLVACSKDDPKVPVCENCNFDCLDGTEEDVLTNDCQENFDCTFTVFANAKFDSNEFFGKGNGNKNLFQILTSTEGSSEIADDEFTNILVFELDSEQNDFSADETDFATMNAHFKRLCFCAETDFKEITAGCIQGMKDENGVWFLQGNVDIEYEFGIITQQFDLQLEEG